MTFGAATDNLRWPSQPAPVQAAPVEPQPAPAPVAHPASGWSGGFLGKLFNKRA